MKAMNKEAALERIGGDEELLVDLGQIFDNECPKMFAEIHEAESTEDAEKLCGAAHRLKGAASMFCAERASKAALDLEELARAGDIASARAMSGGVEREMEELRAELRQLSQMTRQ